MFILGWLFFFVVFSFTNHQFNQLFHSMEIMGSFGFVLSTHQSDIFTIANQLNRKQRERELFICSFGFLFGVLKCYLYTELSESIVLTRQGTITTMTVLFSLPSNRKHSYYKAYVVDVLDQYCIFEFSFCNIGQI